MLWLKKMKKQQQQTIMLLYNEVSLEKSTVVYLPIYTVRPINGTHAYNADPNERCRKCGISLGSVSALFVIIKDLFRYFYVCVLSLKIVAYSNILKAVKWCMKVLRYIQHQSKS